MKGIVIVTWLLTSFAFKASAQTRIRLEEAQANVGKRVEVLGHAYLVKVVNKDFVMLKVAYSPSSDSLVTYYKFRFAQSFATLTNREFGHLIGVVILVNKTPVLIVQKPHNARFYVPHDEWVDSGFYYLKKRGLPYGKKSTAKL